MHLSASQIDNLILHSDTDTVIECNEPPEKEQPEKGSVWHKTPFVNLVRYKPSQVYFARFRIKGKLIRRSLIACR
jgi:hypothetical protein